MKNRGKILSIGLVFIFLGIIIIAACNQNQDKKVPEQNASAATESLKPEETSFTGYDENVPPEPDMTGIIIMVDGVKLTKADLEKELNTNLNMIKAQIPANKLNEAKADLKDQIINSFVVTTLLTNEIKKRNIKATEKEIADETTNFKESLPPQLSFEEFLKSNNITTKQLRERVIMQIQVTKLLKSAVPAPGKITDKEISDFYKQNKDKLFVTPEAAQARHILIKTESNDDEPTLKAKKEKAESIRKELLEGEDFAQAAAKYSDDHQSAQQGGDLGMFTRGQMVKPFEAAAFSQKVNEIGPVVKTEFGYHIIQIITREDKKPVPLNEEIKSQISSFLFRKKQEQGNQNFIKQLQEKATIIVNRNA